jgi:hypothetical protein
LFGVDYRFDFVVLRFIGRAGDLRAVLPLRVFVAMAYSFQLEIPPSP